MGLFGKNKNKQKNDIKKVPGITAFDNMSYIIVSTNSDEQLLHICDTILSGRAVLANFNKISTTDANSMLAFIAGAIYAVEGQYFQLEPKLFLFARKEELEDGSLYQYVEDTK